MEKHREKKLLIVTGPLNIGGTEKHIAMVAPKLLQKGFIVDVFNIAEKGPLATELESKGVRVIPTLKAPPERAQCNTPTPVMVMRPTTFLKLGKATWSLYKLIKKEKYSIVHFFLPIPYILGTPIAVLLRVPVRVMSRRSLNNYQKSLPGFRIMELICHRFMTYILGNSQRVVDQIKTVEKVPGNNQKFFFSMFFHQARSSAANSIFPSPGQKDFHPLIEIQDGPNKQTPVFFSSHVRTDNVFNGSLIEVIKQGRFLVVYHLLNIIHALTLKPGGIWSRKALLSPLSDLVWYKASHRFTKNEFPVMGDAVLSCPGLCGKRIFVYLHCLSKLPQLHLHGNLHAEINQIVVQ